MRKGGSLRLGHRLLAMRKVFLSDEILQYKAAQHFLVFFFVRFTKRMTCSPS